MLNQDKSTKSRKLGNTLRGKIKTENYAPKMLERNYKKTEET